MYRGRSEAIRAAMAFLLEHQVERMPADVQREVHKVLSSIRQEARVARREALAHAVEAAVRMVDTMIRDREWNELTEWVVGDGRALSLVLEGEKRARIDGVIETATRWLGTAGTTEE